MQFTADLAGSQNTELKGSHPVVGKMANAKRPHSLAAESSDKKQAQGDPPKGVRSNAPRGTPPTTRSQARGSVTTPSSAAKETPRAPNPAKTPPAPSSAAKKGQTQPSPVQQSPTSAPPAPSPAAKEGQPQLSQVQQSTTSSTTEKGAPPAT